MVWDCFLDEELGEAAKNVASIGCLEPLFENVVRAVIALSVITLFVMLLMGGFNFLFSGGDQKKLEVARGTLTNAIIGLVVIALAFLIIKAISTITGLPDILQFTIPTE